MWAAIQSLPPRQRAVIVARFHDDLPMADVAARLNCSARTAAGSCGPRSRRCEPRHGWPIRGLMSPRTDPCPSKGSRHD
ncbi:MAG: RNA polymerase sigma factor [Mycobacteriales bacterium]